MLNNMQEKKIINRCLALQQPDDLRRNLANCLDTVIMVDLNGDLGKLDAFIGAAWTETAWNGAAWTEAAWTDEVIWELNI
ncbi:hypothetical protein [Flavitalea sp.]|nr:hypothetical protein [Flavitalea sp.]